MPVRQYWEDSLHQAERRLIGEAATLHATTTRIPVDLHALANQLGARLERSTSEETQHGSLHRTNGEWIIRFNAQHPVRRQRFTIAHEMAHLLFSLAGIQPPSSTGEYWILEKACHVVASELLVPNTMAPTALIPRTDLRRLMYELTQRFLLSREAASRYLLRRSSNFNAIAGALYVPQEMIVYTQWSETRTSADLASSQDDISLWPGPRTKLQLHGAAHLDFCRLVSSACLQNEVNHFARTSHSTLVAIPSGRLPYSNSRQVPLTILFDLNNPPPSNQLTLF